MWLVVKLFSVFEFSLQVRSIFHLIDDEVLIVGLGLVFHALLHEVKLVGSVVAAIELILLELLQVFQLVYLIVEPIDGLFIYVLRVVILFWTFGFSVVVNPERPIGLQEQRVRLGVILIGYCFPFQGITDYWLWCSIRSLRELLRLRVVPCLEDAWVRQGSSLDDVLHQLRLREIWIVLAELI